MSKANNFDFKIRVNPDVAFSVIYEDSHGSLIFTIEVGDDSKRIYLNPSPVEDEKLTNPKSEFEKKRISVAVTRVQEYFEAKGLTVEFD